MEPRTYEVHKPDHPRIGIARFVQLLDQLLDVSGPIRKTLQFHPQLPGPEFPATIRKDADK